MFAFFAGMMAGGIVGILVFYMLTIDRDRDVYAEYKARLNSEKTEHVYDIEEAGTDDQE